MFDTFKKSNIMIYIETNLTLKCLRFGNGKEYTDGGYKEYCCYYYHDREDHFEHTTQ